MKTRISTTLTAILLSLNLSWADGTSIDGIHYRLDDSKLTASVTYTGWLPHSANGYAGSITIPTAVTYGGNTYSVRSIGKNAFRNCKDLESVDIPASVTSIGENAFYGCKGLLTIDIPASVTSIGVCAFSGCTSLASIRVETGNAKYDSREDCSAIIETTSNRLIAGCKTTVIPLSVTAIGRYAFYLCESLESVDIPASVTAIGNYAFSGCKGLSAIDIPASVTAIGNYAFSGCKGLSAIDIPASVTSIAVCAFSGCTSLTSMRVEAGNTKYDSRKDCNAIIETTSNKLVAGCKTTVIPASVTDIGEAAFSGCESLENIDIPGSVKAIGDYAFSKCTGLKSIEIPPSVTTIGKSAFEDCEDLWVIENNSSVAAIMDYAFSNCTSLKFINIPVTVTTIGEGAFLNCKRLDLIEIPGSVEDIGYDAFSGCTGLKSIDIPASVKAIGDYAFSYCKSLTSIRVEAGNTKYDSREGCNAIIETTSNKLVTGCKTTVIPASVTDIGEAAFSGCESLERIDIPVSVTGIGDYAFSNCTLLKSIEIPSSVTSIGEAAFSGCESLERVTALRTDPEGYHCNEGAFQGSSTSIATLHVPAGCKELYMSCSPWNEFGAITDDVTGISREVITVGEVADGAMTIPGNYNLKGQRISVPLRGVFIKDGRKVLK